MGRVYIHELVDVVGTERARYQHHMTANWCPEAGPLRRQRCFGVFSVVGSTGRWPQVVNLWEYDSWADLGHNFSVELVGAGHRDPMLAEWWERAAAFRSGGSDRLLVAHPTSPGIEQWCAEGGTGAVAYVHETLRTAPGGAAELCELLADPTGEGYAAEGLTAVALFRVALGADDEVLALWAVPDWPTWSAVESRLDLAAVERGGGLSSRVLARERLLLVDAELSPLRIARQPVAQDRRSLDEI
ncbi:MAG: NIPSNAP family containing protein [Microthrixaceae bacterium]